MKKIALVVVVLAAAVVLLVRHAPEPTPVVVGDAPAERVQETDSPPPVPSAPPIPSGPGSLVLEFLDGENGVAGVEVEIFDGAKTFPCVSDQAGIVKQELPDGTYRWRLVSEHVFPVTPADPSAELEEGWSRTSAEFDVHWGEGTAFTMQRGICLVLGWVFDQAGAPVQGFRLRLNSQHVRVSPAGTDFDDSWLADVDGEFDGSFRLTGIRASQPFTASGETHLTEKALSITRQTGGDVYTSRRVFTLAQDEIKDLGAIVLHEDPCLEIEVAFEDEHGAPVEPFTEPTTVLLTVFTSTYVPMSEVVSEVLTVRPGVTRFHDIPAGEYVVSADEPLEGWPPLKEGFALLEEDLYDPHVRAPGKVKVAFTAAAGVVDVRVVIPPLQQSERRLTVWAKREGEGLTQARARMAGGEIVAPFRLPAGNYVFSASNNDFDAARDHPSLWGEMNAAVTEPCSVTLLLGAGSRISGTVEDGLKGGPYHGLVKFRDSEGRVFKVNSDESGEFSINGLPAEGCLTVYGVSVPCGATGVKLQKFPDGMSPR